MKKIAIIIALVFLSQIHGQTFAQVQMRTNSNTVTTTVGTVTDNANIATVAIELATTIGKACGGTITGGNVGSCLNGLHFQNVSYPEMALSQIINSAKTILCDGNNSSKGTCLQCVGFVTGVVSGTTGQNFNNGGNASDYATNIPSGYIYIQRSSGTPVEVGDIIVKTGGFGHIAIVTEISNTQTGINVAEANYNLGGEIAIRASQLTLWDGWLRKL